METLEEGDKTKEALQFQLDWVTVFAPFVPLKSILLDGVTDSVTYSELVNFNSKLELLLTNIFDLLNVGKDELKAFKETYPPFMVDKKYTDLYTYFLTSAENINQNVIHHPQEKVELDLKEIIKSADYVTDYKFNFDKFAETVFILKEKVLKGNPSKLTSNELFHGIDIVIDVLKKAFFAYHAYNELNNFMISTLPIEAKTVQSEVTFEDALMGLNFDHLYKIDLYETKKIKEDFLRIITSYHYYRDSYGLSYYRNDYIRYREGVIEYSLLDHAIEILLSAYAKTIPPDERGHAQGTTEELNGFLYDLKPLLAAFNLWSQNPKTFAENAVLLSDLFQMNSNGSGTMNLMEGTSYVSLVLNAVLAGDELFALLKNTECLLTPENEGDADRYDPECYRKYYFKFLLNEEYLGHKKYYTKLHDFTTKRDEDELIKYVEYIEKFARDTPDKEAPIFIRDIYLLTGALLNIESMYARFDVDNSNYLEPSEVEAAYPIYQDIIIKLGNIEDVTIPFYGEIKKEELAHSIFLYMLEFKELPLTETWWQNVKLLRYHFAHLGENTTIGAERINIASLLYYIVMLRDEPLTN
jgi:hypothetical protein